MKSKKSKKTKTVKPKKKAAAQPQLVNVNISGSESLPTPNQVKKLLPASPKILNHVHRSRQVLKDILDGNDPRYFFVVGPCSIHDPKAALEYAKRLKKLSDEVGDLFVLVMRVYFEKPRTTVGWKGLINDPKMDDSFHVEEGIKIARKLLIQFNNLGLPTATEALDPIIPQYISELISWSAIGARTTESQTHREMASGLSMPVGFKNATDGGMTVAANAVKSAKSSHHFLGINQDGKICKFSTKGNEYAHIVLRGGDSKPNYDRESIKRCEEELTKNGLRAKIVVDCSHANSNKNHELQANVLEDCVNQILDSNRSIVGFMIESNLSAGNQKIPANLKELKYGVSVTDACVDWETTEKMIGDAYRKIRAFRKMD